ncbi:MAG: sigma-70 family RNA polymerase sigma factor [Deltaproteobacteria bacterium]|nr:sigma-70 family RNA polymerase sigma factor [Deltaproteobacteria bacterium]
MLLFFTFSADTEDWQRRIRDQYYQFGPALRRRCERVLQNTGDAEDIVQDLFMDIWNKKRADLGFPYLYSAVTNRCITLLRKQTRHRILLEKQCAPDVLHGLLQDDSVYTAQCIRDIAQTLDRTSGAIFLYRYIDDMTQEEIGEVMGLSRKTIGKKLARLDKKLAGFSLQHEATLMRKTGDANGC